jgi:hypothetical protein
MYKVAAAHGWYVIDGIEVRILVALLSRPNSSAGDDRTRLRTTADVAARRRVCGRWLRLLNLGSRAGAVCAPEYERTFDCCESRCLRHH